MNISFLTLAEVLEIHANQVELYGGSTGIRDKGLLESAIAQPASKFDDEFLHKTVTEMAAAYLFHIVKNHPFIDGNKRAGAVSAIVFLEINEYELDISEELLEETVLGVASGKIEKDDLVQFFNESSKPK